MKNTLRCLVFDDQVSLTMIDTTELVRQAVKLHNLSRPAAITLGKTLSAVAFMSASLKEATGQVSASLKGDGLGGAIGVSGDFALHIRGYIDEPSVEVEERAVLGENGSLTVVRDDGYSRPFVGSCGFAEGGVDGIFEEYYRISEQLPTYFGSRIRFDESGQVAFAGITVLQPLPFADPATLDRLPKGEELGAITEEMQKKGILQTAREYFAVEESRVEWKTAVYQCHCSRAYLAEVLSSLGEAQMRQIVKEDGAVKAHCHYCNTDYLFGEEDIEKIFPHKG